MSTLPQAEKQATISFRVPESFKREFDSRLGKMGATSQEFCTRAIAEKLGIPVPGEEPVTPAEQPRRRKSDLVA